MKPRDIIHEVDVAVSNSYPPLAYSYIGNYNYIRYSSEMPGDIYLRTNMSPKSDRLHLEDS